MTTDGDHGLTAPADDLQFDHVEYAEQPPAAAPTLGCGVCARPIAETYYEAGGKVLCDGCRDAVIRHFTGGSRLARFLRALAFGGLAALAGSGLYYLVLAITGYEVGLIAIVVGVMVGSAVNNGSRQRGGLVYQLLAVFLTYTAIVSSYVPILLARNGNKGDEMRGAAAPANPEVPAVKPEPVEAKVEAPADPVAPRRAAPADDLPGVKREEPEVGQNALALLFLLVITMGFLYTDFFVYQVQNPIGLLIVFFALAQAWRLNRKVRPEIKGPFVVGSSSPPLEGAAAHA
jgi:hypothetical protein